MLRNYLTPQAYQSLQEEKAQRLVKRTIPLPYIGDDPVEFIQTEMVIPETGKALQLHPEQAAVLRAMSHLTNGLFDYSTWLYSSPKKSGKTTIGAGVALWQAWNVPDGSIYIIGNDQRQADNRMMEAIRYAIMHNERLSKHARIVRYTVYLDNGTRIESIPVDPKGEAGMNPTGLFWTEAWGAMGKAAEMLWSEATLSPTRAGKSFKFVESYAGYQGESLILERLYDGIVQNGVLHSDIPELYVSGQSIGYWCTRRYLPWQQDAGYYAQQALEKTPNEFSRQHDNQWSTSEDVFVPAESWYRCGDEQYEGIQPDEPVIISADAGVSSDTFAVIVVTKRGDKVQIQYVRKWQPINGQKLDYQPIEDEIKRLVNTYNVLELAYDEFQLHSMMGRIRSEESINCRVFNQASPRAVADKRFYDLIMLKRIQHGNKFPDLTEHVLNSNRKPEDDAKLRIIKRTAEKKIDACVAASMAVDRVHAYAFD